MKKALVFSSHKYEVSCLLLLHHERLSNQRSDVTYMGYDRETNTKRISATPVEKAPPYPKGYTAVEGH